MACLRRRLIFPFFPPESCCVCPLTNNRTLWLICCILPDYENLEVSNSWRAVFCVLFVIADQEYPSRRGGLQYRGRQRNIYAANIYLADKQTPHLDGHALIYWGLDPIATP